MKVKRPTWSTGSRRPRLDPGFTLIELMVVVVVVGVLSAVAIPRFAASADRAALREAARSLVSAAQYARSEAVLRRRVVRLGWLPDVDPARPGDQPGYRLEAQVDAAAAAAGSAFAAVTRGAVKPTPVGGRVSLQRLVLADGSTADAVRFYPSGRSDAASIQLASAAAACSVLIEPITGRAKWVEGLAPAPTPQREDLDA